MSQAGRTRYFARSATGARSARRGGIFLSTSSRALRSCRAPREISRSSRLAHKAPVMQARLRKDCEQSSHVGTGQISCDGILVHIILSREHALAVEEIVFLQDRFTSYPVRGASAGSSTLSQVVNLLLKNSSFMRNASHLLSRSILFYP